jgi:hypothetical protein
VAGLLRRRWGGGDGVGHWAEVGRETYWYWGCWGLTVTEGWTRRRWVCIDWMF